MLTINQVLFHFNFFTLHLKLPLKHYYTFYLLKYFSPSQVDDHRRIYSSHSWTITMIRFLEECRSWPLIMMICLVCITLDFRVGEIFKIFFNFPTFKKLETWKLKHKHLTCHLLSKLFVHIVQLLSMIDFIHVGQFCPCSILSMFDFVHLQFCPYSILSILSNAVHWCPDLSNFYFNLPILIVHF